MRRSERNVSRQISLALLALAVGALLFILFRPVSVRAMDDAAAIRQLVDRYYSALSGGRYDEAVKCYEPGTFAGSGLKPEQALAQAVELGGGVPAGYKLEGLKIAGNRARAMLTVKRKGIGPVSAVVVERGGNELGTWARDLSFAKSGEQWYISGKGSDRQEEAASRALKILQEIQAGNRKKPADP